MTTEQAARPPRLAILVSSDRRRGAEVFAETLAGGLRRRGWDVDLSSLSSAVAGPRVAATPLSPAAPDRLSKLDRTVVAALRRRMATLRPDVVLANGSSTLQYAVAALRLGRHRPRLVYVSIGEPMYWIRGTRHRLLRRAILKGADRVFSVSATTAGQLVDHLGVPPGKVRVAPTGVPARFFDVARAERGEELRVVFIGNLSLEKDPVEALDIVAGLAVTAPVRLRFLGGGPLQERLEREVVARRLEGRVEVLGSVPDVLPHLAWADALLLTSRTEGLPGVPLEAAAAGVPSVVYAVGGAAETVIDGETGRIVEAGDAAGATAALATLAADRDLARRWGEAARHLARERFTLEAAVHRYATLLTDEVAGVRRIGLWS